MSEWAQGRTMGRASRASAQGSNLRKVLRPHWNNRKYGASRLSFRHAKNLSENYPVFMPPQKGSPALC